MPSSPVSFSSGEDAVDGIVLLDNAADTQIPGGHHLLFVPANDSALPDYLRRCRDGSVNTTARQDSINWILKVHAHHRFKPETAFLAVNYLDRFLSRNSLPSRGWAFQLLSVACLSLAAKMEEKAVPLLLDLQLFQPHYVFHPKTVQRMELRVMSTLQWRLRSVTPFDYLHYFISHLQSSSTRTRPQARLFSASSLLILSTTRVVDFLEFTPPTVAAAAVLCAAGEPVDSAAGRLFFSDTINREMVRSCHQLLEEFVIDTCPAALFVNEPASPPSPVGVLDAAACRSCDNRSENPSTQAAPLAKRLRSSAPDVP